MRRFDFSLERVRQFRREQAEIEEAKLGALLAERRKIERQREVLAEQRAEAERLALQLPVRSAVELGAVDAFGRHVRSERERLARKIVECDARITGQRRSVAEAQRRYRLLEKLKERRMNEWRREYDRELEILAAEAYLAGWSRRAAASAP